MKIGSLFSGYAGLDLAVAEVTGATVAWHAEVDKHAAAILAANAPDVPNLGDITAVDWAAVEPVDILTGGFPCQDVSHAGNRAGIKPGTRSGLWTHMAYIIRTLKPRLVVIENVSGLLSADAAGDVEPCPWCLGDEPGGHLRALGAVLADLAEIGFDAEWASVRASDAGACHRRERVFIVATDATRERGHRPWTAGTRRWTGPANDSGEPVALLKTPTTDAAKHPHGRPDRWDSRNEPGGRFELADQIVALLPTPAVNDMGDGKTPAAWDEWTDAMRARHGNGNGHGKSLAIEAQRLLPTPKASDGPNGGPGMRNGRGQADALPGVVALLPTPGATRGGSHTETRDMLLSTPTAGLGEGGGQRSHRWAEGSGRTHNPTELAHDIANGVLTDFGPYAAAIARWATVIGRPAPPPTEPGKDGRPRLSPAFVEWMMGLPAGWVTGTGIPRNAQLKALGNGVVPQQAALALFILLPRLGGAA